jgi:SnoaL-like protein
MTATLSVGRKVLDGFCHEWMARWNAHDRDGLVDLTTPDVVWNDRTFWPHVIHGHDELRRYIDKIFAIMPDVEFDEVGRFFDADDARANVLWRMRGSGPPSVAPDRRFEFEGCDIFLAFRDGKLAHYQAAYDITDMMRQLGLLPPREDRIGGAYFLGLLRQHA